ncbi:MAG TPA: hypothetical protein VM344_09805 [Vitreimonas sp.]|nr:hypothetical protein [Vitreimonas sp.]
MIRMVSTAVALIMLLVAAPAAAAQQTIVLEFEKQWAGPDYYVGTIDGGGTIEMWLYDKSVIGKTQHFSARVDVTLPGRSFSADVSGHYTFSTGRVVLTGTVTSGWLAGAQVVEQSQLVDPTTGSFIGTVRINPASS